MQVKTINGKPQNCYSCPQCGTREECRQEQWYLHETDGVKTTVGDLEKCTALAVRAALNGNLKVGQPPLARGQPRLDRVKQLRAEGSSRAAGAFNPVGAAAEAEVGAYFAPMTRPDERVARAVLTERETAKGWENETKATPSHTRWGRYVVNAETLEMREAMRAVDATRALAKFSDELHFAVVSGGLLDPFFEENSAGEKRRNGVDMTPEAVLASVRVALQEVAERGTERQRTEASKWLRAQGLSSARR